MKTGETRVIIYTDRARSFGWSWLTLSQRGEKVERVMGIEPT
jgi:hypothetical protein